MRRVGVPLVMPMGSWGWGGMGSPLLTTLMAGGLGYALGSNSGQQNTPQYPPYPPQPYPYQAPPPPSQSQDNGKLAQLQLLGRLRESEVLTEDEFEREKQRILSS